MASVQYGGTQSHSRRLCTLKICGTSEILQIPIEVTTKVLAIRQLVSSRVGLEPESLTFVVKSASSTRVLRDSDEIPSQALDSLLIPVERVVRARSRGMADVAAKHGPA